MSTPILATKLYIPPPRSKVVTRPRLSERLNTGHPVGHMPGVSLISAPAGFGKTTLVSEWIAGGEQREPALRVAWLSLDEADNDPARFLTYLVAALQTIAPHLGAGLLRVLQAPQPPPTDALLTSLINDLTTLPEPVVLVLDDYHVIEARAVDQALTFLLEHLPPQLHLVIATRADPDLPLARLRARDQLTELRASDLRFTPAEAAEFLNQAMGLQLSANDVAALETRTEGWIAGLQLAALALQGTRSRPEHTDASRFIQSFTGSHHFVMDYLIEEVLQQQPERVQTFLLRTSILDRLCGPLCEAVLQAGANPPSGQATLEYLERANLLVVPLDDQREWYRYHHLFADVLQARLLKEQPSQLAGLHLLACAWYEQNNFLAEAIHHALAAGDFERAADLIELERSLSRGAYFRSATWLGWVKALPDELVRARPMLSVGFAWELLFLGELEAAEARLRDAERWLAERPTEMNDPPETPATTPGVMIEAKFQSQQVWLAIARAFQAQAHSDALGTVKHARRALLFISESDNYLHGLASALLGVASWTTGDLETAYQYMADGMASLRTAGYLLFATSGTSVLANIRMAQGRLRDAVDIYEQALHLVTAQGGPVLQTTADLYLGLSELSHEQGDMEAARQYLLRSEELGQQTALDDWPYRLYLARARMKEYEGDTDGALKMLEEADRIYYRTPLPNVRPVGALKTRIWIGQGRLTEALGWARRQALSSDDDLSYRREFEHLTLARVLIASYRSQRAERPLREAIGLLERLLKAAEDGGRMGSAIEILVLQALAHQAHGNLSLALAPLERALTLAGPEGFVRIFVGEGIPMAELLKRVKPEAEKMKEQAGYVDKLLAAFGKPPDTRPATHGRPPLIEPLSQRELEILHLIAEGLSNHEISQRLFLALNTVKGHNQKIFDKLQVQRRTEAVARARELGLL